MKKIWNGMPNGATDINDNFNEVVSGYVKNTDDEIISGKKTFTNETILALRRTDIANLGGGVKIRLKRVGQLVTVSFLGQTTSDVKGGIKMSGTIPLGFRPDDGTEPVVFLAVGRHIDTYFYFNKDGSVAYQGEDLPKNSYLRGVACYITSDPLPEK